MQPICRFPKVGCIFAVRRQRWDSHKIGPVTGIGGLCRMLNPDRATRQHGFPLRYHHTEHDIVAVQTAGPTQRYEKKDRVPQRGVGRDGSETARLRAHP